ncbi:hypothetical protein [Rhodococcoides yunnanense]|uniref:hypothetical protein n=1 Tax=Rhodococcoides yunnanense TaxID=278209 RepID=UPI0022B0D988|nr:hypothetical protein [Rhodococcus yunnanensis]MCZ4279025.1 hypothetical protein [Rhodococcus yunnanensis]
MISSYRRAAAGLFMVAVLVLGCSYTAGKSVNESLTSDESMNRTLEYLEESLAALPSGARLDRVHPELPVGDLGYGGFAPCYDSNTVVEGPEYFGVGFWVVDGGDGPAGLKSVVERWTEWGWTGDDRAPDGDRYAQRTSPDEYTLTAQLSTSGHLSLSGSSPCFPFENGTDLDVQGPGVIEQP